MNDMIKFLHARVSDDARDPDYSTYGGIIGTSVILLMIQEYERVSRSLAAFPSPSNIASFMTAQNMIRIIVAAYSDHSEYQDEWRPNPLPTIDEESAS